MHEKANDAFFHLQSLNAVAVTYQNLGDSKNARIYFDRAIERRKGRTSARIQDLLRANLAGDVDRAGRVRAGGRRCLEGVLARGLDAYPALR